MRAVGLLIAITSGTFAIVLSWRLYRSQPRSARQWMQRPENFEDRDISHDIRLLFILASLFLFGVSLASGSLQ